MPAALDLEAELALYFACEALAAAEAEALDERDDEEGQP